MLDFAEIFQTVPIIGYAVSGLFGLVFGSFFTFLSYRILNRKPWLWGAEAKRSQCANCHTVLSARDLIPVISWLMSHGLCRYCQTPISIRYPLIELGTALSFMIIYHFFTV